MSLMLFCRIQDKHKAIVFSYMSYENDSSFIALDQSSCNSYRKKMLILQPFDMSL